jgi:hypothetical protein
MPRAKYSIAAFDSPRLALSHGRRFELSKSAFDERNAAV